MKGVLSVILFVAALLVSGCGVQSPALQVATGHPAPAEWLVVHQVTEAGEHVRVVEGTTGETVRDLPSGVLAPDGRTLYSVLPTGDETRVRALDVTDGTVLREMMLSGVYRLPLVGFGQRGGLSPDGDWLALEAAANSYSARASRFAVLETTFEGEPRLVALPRGFHFDALADAGSLLYLVEMLDDGSLYRVRVYDLVRETLSPDIIADKRNQALVMSGERLVTRPSPDGRWLYSLYLNWEHGPFIHALNLAERVALCIDLPGAQAAESETDFGWSLAMSTDGQRLYTANGAQGTVAEVDLVNGEVRRDAQWTVARAAPEGLLARLARALVPGAAAKEALPSGSALSPDEQWLYVVGARGIFVLDVETLTQREHWLAEHRLTGVLVSADGAHLYAAGATGDLLAVETATGQVLHHTPGTAAMQTLLGLVTP